MARGQGSTFDPLLGHLAAEGVGAYACGLVAGRSQTIYPWDSWVRDCDAEPAPWFHDVLRPDGTPYDTREVEHIRRVTRRR